MFSSLKQEISKAKQADAVEIGATKLISLVEDSCYFVACSFSKKPLPFAEPASYKPLITQLLALFIAYLSGKKWDIVATRCLGPSNSSLGIKGLIKAIARFTLKRMSLFISSGKDTKLVIVDFTDHITIHPSDRSFLKKSDLYFKRELAQNGWNSFEKLLPNSKCVGYAQITPFYQESIQKLRSVSLGWGGVVPELMKDYSKKKYDFFYICETRQIEARSMLEQKLKALKDQGVRVFLPDRRLTQEEFATALMESWFCPSPMGGGWDCYRHYEAALHSSIPILNPPSIRGHKVLSEEEQTCLYWDIHSDLDKCLSDARKISIDERIKCIEKSYNHTMKHHTHLELGRYILNELELKLVI